MSVNESFHEHGIFNHKWACCLHTTWRNRGTFIQIILPSFFVMFLHLRSCIPLHLNSVFQIQTQGVRDGQVSWSCNEDRINFLVLHSLPYNITVATSVHCDCHNYVTCMGPIWKRRSNWCPLHFNYQRMMSPQPPEVLIIYWAFRLSSVFLSSMVCDSLLDPFL